MAAFLDVCRFNPTLGGTTDWTFSTAVQGYQTPTLAGASNGRVYKYRAESADLSQWELGEGAYSSGTGVFARTTVLYNSSGTGTAPGQSGVGSKISFSTVPQVAIVALKEDLVSIEEANAFTVAQQAQTRSNIAASGLAAMAMKNAIVNAAMDVSQELAGQVTLVNNTGRYTADQWIAIYNHTAATAVVVSSRFSIASLGVPLVGFQFCHLIQATTAISSPASGDFACHRQFVEGYRVAHWGWGATGAAAISVAFQFYSTVSGTAFVRLSNGATANRFYYHEITVAAGLWNFYSFVVPGDTSGTWAKDNTRALTIEVFGSGKETTPQASLDGWGATAKLQTTNSTNLLGTANNATLLTGMYVDANGGQLPSAAELPLVMRPFDHELQICQRYWCKSYDYTVYAGDTSIVGALSAVSTYAAAGNSFWIATYPFPVRMCKTPTVTVYATNSGTANRIREFVTPTDRTIDSLNVSNAGALVYTTQFNYGQPGACHLICDARL